MSEYKRHTIRRNGKIQQVCDGCSLFASGLCKVVDCKQARKETVKEIFQHIKILLDDCEDINVRIHYVGLLAWLRIAFGVEVEE